MITEDEIRELNFIKNEDLSTDEVSLYEFKFNRPDLNPLYADTLYQLFWYVDTDQFSLEGKVMSNKQRAYFTNSRVWLETELTKDILDETMLLFLKKDLQNSPLIRKSK